ASGDAEGAVVRNRHDVPVTGRRNRRRQSTRRTARGSTRRNALERNSTATVTPQGAETYGLLAPVPERPPPVSDPLSPNETGRSRVGRAALCQRLLPPRSAPLSLLALSRPFPRFRHLRQPCPAFPSSPRPRTDADMAPRVPRLRQERPPPQRRESYRCRPAVGSRR